jgi:hypothetical protein
MQGFHNYWNYLILNNNRKPKEMFRLEASLVFLTSKKDAEANEELFISDG